MAGLLEDYLLPGQVPNINIPPDEEALKQAKALALMRLGFGMAGGQNIGNAMQGGINTYAAGVEEARRMAATQAQLAMQQYKAQEQYRDAMKKAMFIKNMDTNTLLAAKIPQVIIDAVKNSENPAEATMKLIDFFKEKVNKPGDVVRNPITGEVEFQVPQRGEVYQFGPSGAVAMGQVPGASQTIAATERAQAYGKGIGQAATELQKVPVAGGGPGQEEWVPKIKLLQEAERTAPTQPSPTTNANPWQIPPSVQAERDQGRLAILNDELKNAVASGNKTEIAALQKEIAMTQGKLQTGATAAIQSPQSTGRRISDPVAEKRQEIGQQALLDVSKPIFTSERNRLESSQAIYQHMQNMKDLDAKGIFDGPAGVATAASVNLFNSILRTAGMGDMEISAKRLANTDTFRSELSKMQQALGKAFPGQQSNYELQTVTNALPDLMKSPEGRRQIYRAIENAYKWQESSYKSMGEWAQRNNGDLTQWTPPAFASTNPTAGPAASAPPGESNATTTAFPKGPPVGTRMGGFRYKGGDPNDPKSWEKVTR